MIDWKPIASAPKDGTTVNVRTADGRAYTAHYASTISGEVSGWYVRGHGGYFQIENPVEWSPA